MTFAATEGAASEHVSIPAVSVGATVFVQSYLSTIGVAGLVTDGQFDEGAAWSAVPLVGPWAALGAYEAVEDPTTGATDVVATAGYVSTGILQAAGLITLTIGLVAGDRERARIAVGPDGVALRWPF